MLVKKQGGFMKINKSTRVKVIEQLIKERGYSTHEAIHEWVNASSKVKKKMVQSVTKIKA